MTVTTAPVPPIVPSRKARLGMALRGIRSRRRLSLADVAALTGIAVSTLSKVENGQLSPTYDKLVQLSQGLGVDITEFFDVPAGAPAEQPVGKRRSVARLADGQVLVTPNYDFRYLFNELKHKAMVPMVITIRARSLVQFAALSRHPGEELLYVLRGRITVHTELHEPLDLAAGEGMYLDSTLGHASVTAGPRSAQVLSVCCPGAATQAP